MWSLRIYQTSLDVVYIMFLDMPQSWADAVNSPAQLAWPPHADFCRALGSRTRYAHHGPHTCDQYPRYHPSPPEQKSHCYQQYVITVLLVVLCHHYTGIITIICRFPSWRVEGCIRDKNVIIADGGRCWDRSGLAAAAYAVKSTECPIPLVHLTHDCIILW